MAQNDKNQQLDALCDGFESEWKAGRRPEIQEWVRRALPELQDQLLNELVRLDLEYQLEDNSGLCVSQYLKSFGVNRSDIEGHDSTATAPRSPQPIRRLVAPAGAEIGQFRLERVVGRGGFGVVYLATDTQLKRDVALKIPRDELDAPAKQRFLREAEAIASLNHPAIVSVYDAGETGDFCYIATAFCNGPTLSQWMSDTGDISIGIAVSVVRHLAEAMEHAHSRGVIHRDLKPSNVMLVPVEDANQEFPFDVVITDFGLAKLLERRLEDTNSSVVLGTPAYMAPEQIIVGDNPPSGHSADIYSLGVILYELLTGSRPFEASSVVAVMDAIRTQKAPDVSALRNDLPRDVATICMKCLEKRSEDRYENCAQLAEDLTRVERGESIAARRPTMREKTRRVLAQPARVKEAGTISMLLGFSVPIWVTVSILFIVWSDLVPELHAALVPQAGMLSLLLMAPLAWTGFRTWQGSIGWAKFGLVFAIFNMMVCILPLLGPTLVFPEVYAQYPMARVIVYPFLTIIYAIQVMQYTIILKYRRERNPFGLPSS